MSFFTISMLLDPIVMENASNVWYEFFSQISNGNHKLLISKIIGYWLDQCDVISINTTIWDQTKSRFLTLTDLYINNQQMLVRFFIPFTRKTKIIWRGIFKVLEYMYQNFRSGDFPLTLSTVASQCTHP